MRMKNETVTRVTVHDFSQKINHQTKVFMLGSCFTEHIADKLERCKYNVLSNPFGILYNPVSIARAIQRIVDLAFYTEDEIVFHQGLYHSMDHHGRFSSKSKQEVLDRINTQIESAHDWIKRCALTFISPGTSKVYRYKKTNQIVGNCHKIPGTEFVYEQLSSVECEKAFEDINTKLKSVAPNCQIIWTVSPVRHLRDGLVENQVSKATLLLSIHNDLKKHSDSSYFPAYEIMMDELRDYRYYNRDMMHPSPLAVDIIWDRFENAFMDDKTRSRHTEIENVRKAMEHRFLHDDSEAMRAFAQGQLNVINQLEREMNGLDWTKERNYFKEIMKD